MMAEANVSLGSQLAAPLDSEHGPNLGQGDSECSVSRKTHPEDKLASYVTIKLCEKSAKCESTNDENSPETRSVLSLTSIQDLPNVLLIHILCFLDIKNRIRAELVCKRWRRVVKELPWSSPTELVLTGNVSKSSLNMSINQLDDNILRTVLSRCGSCLKVLVLKTTKCAKMTTAVTRNSVFEIGQYCQNLETLKLRFPVDNACLKAVAAGCPKLKSVKIINSGQEQCAEGLLAVVHESRALECLRISDQRLAGNWFTLVNRKFKTLDLENCELTEIGMLNLIHRCKCLEEFQLDNWKRDQVDETIFFQVIDHFKETLTIVKLKDLSIRQDSNWCRGLKGLRHLKVLVLAFCDSVNDDLMDMISQECSELTTLDISDSKVTDEGLASLASLPSLRTLDISYTHVTGDALKVVACRGILEEVVMQGMVNITEANCCYLARVCPHLRVVDVCGTKQITNRMVGVFCAAIRSGYLKGPVKLFVESTSVARNVAIREGVEVYFPVFVPRIISLDNLESFLNRPEMPNELQSIFSNLAGEVWREQNKTRSIFAFPTERNILLNRAMAFFVSLRRRNFVPNRLRLLLNDLMG